MEGKKGEREDQQGEGKKLGVSTKIRLTLPFVNLGKKAAFKGRKWRRRPKKGGGGDSHSRFTERNTKNLTARNKEPEMKCEVF